MFDHCNNTFTQLIFYHMQNFNQLNSKAVYDDNDDNFSGCYDCFTLEMKHISDLK